MGCTCSSALPDTSLTSTPPNFSTSKLWFETNYTLTPSVTLTEKVVSNPQLYSSVFLLGIGNSGTTTMVKQLEMVCIV